MSLFSTIQRALTGKDVQEEAAARDQVRTQVDQVRGKRERAEEAIDVLHRQAYSVARDRMREATERADTGNVVEDAIRGNLGRPTPQNGR